MVDAQPFAVPFEETTLIGDIYPDGGKPTVLFLHGAGGGHRGRFDLLRERLAQEGIASAAFDCIGHGETGGDLKTSSLDHRTDQTKAAIHHLGLSDFHLVGSSMGGYTAVDLLKSITPLSLTLMVPAAFPVGSSSKRFNDGFTEAIREKDAWKTSEAFSLLKQYTGHVLVLVAENDKIIPPEIPQGLYDAATQAASRELFTIAGADHLLMGHLTRHPEVMDMIVQKMVSIFKTKYYAPAL